MVKPKTQAMYDLLEDAVLEFPSDYISIDYLYLFINRLTHDSKKKWFGFNQTQKDNSRLKYYRHLIMMLVSREIIEKTEHPHKFKINEQKRH